MLEVYLDLIPEQSVPPERNYKTKKLHHTVVCHYVTNTKLAGVIPPVVIYNDLTLALLTTGNYKIHFGGGEGRKEAAPSMTV